MIQPVFRQAAAIFASTRGWRAHWLLLAAGLVLAGGIRTEAATAFPGNPPITPRWTFEPWAWEDDMHTTASAEGLISNYLALKIPVGVIDLDDAWSSAYNNFAFNTTEYANPTNMIQYFGTNGVRVVCWMVGMVDSTSNAGKVTYSEDPGYPTAVADNFGINNNSIYSWWQGSGLGLDFSNTNAVNWFLGPATNLLAMGVSGFKVDMSDGFLPDPLTTTPGSVFGGASISRAQFSEYYYAEVQNWLNTQTITLNGTTRTNEAITLARPWSYQEGTGKTGGPWAGGTGMPVSHLTAGWCGDFHGDFAGFATQLTDVYNSVADGYSTLGFEVGGFINTPTHDSLLRQAEYAALMPVMENGGASAQYHEPWYWDANGYTDTVTTYRYYATLHHNLVPFQFHCSVYANLTGTPAMTQVDTTTDRHLLGNALLTFAVASDVSPVTTGSNAVPLDFPAGGLWINWWNRAQTFNSGTTTNLNYNLDTSPIFIRAGAIIPVNVDSSVTGLGDTNSTGWSTVLLFPDQTNQLVYYRPLNAGIAYETNTLTVVEGTNGYVRVSAPTSQPWIFKIAAFTAPTNVTGAAGWSYDRANNLLTVSNIGAAFTIGISPLAGYYTLAGPPAPVVVNNVTASPAVLTRNESFQVSATVTAVNSTVNSVTLNASGIGAGVAIPLALDGANSTWTNSLTVPGSAAFGSTNLVVTATDVAGDPGGTGSTTVTIEAAQILQLHLALTNSTGTTVLSGADGSLSGLAFTMYNNGSTAAALIANNAAASGLFGGAALDQSADLTASQGTSQPGNTTGSTSGAGPVLQLLNNATLATLGNAGNISAFMASFWLKSVAGATGGNAPRIWVLSAGSTVADYTGTSSIGMQFEGQSASLDDVMYFSIGGNSLLGTLPAGNFPVNTWMYFAVTYDGANMVMYYGATNQMAIQIGSQALAGKIIALGAAASMDLGNSQGKTYDRAFNGWISDFRFYNGVAGSAAQNQAFLQSVQAQQLLQPHFAAFALTKAGGLALSGTGGAANATYYLLSATNLMTPESNWTRLLTNQFDPSGNFSLTNPINKNQPQGYYLLQMP
jgi:hypothetical protein